MSMPTDPTSFGLCHDYSVCFCSAAVDPPAFERGLAASAAYRAEADQIRTLTWHMQHSVPCSMPIRRVRVVFGAYGLGGSILDHLRRLSPVWRTLLPQEESTLPQSIAVPAYDHFAANEGNKERFLWATFDDTLPCESWFGCYWEELAQPCANATVEHVPNNVGLVPYMATGLERRWGTILYSAALLNAWWRPTTALQIQITRAVGRIFRGAGSTRMHARHAPGAAASDDAATAAGATTSSAAASSSEQVKCVALHVRRGDACLTPWRRCPSLAEYLAAARVMARRFGLTSIFVATEDADVLQRLETTRHTADAAEPWSRVLYQEYDRRPFNVSGWHAAGNRYWVEQRLRWSAHGQRPLGRRPVLEFLVDIEAAAHCRALVGTMDSHGSRLILLRMASRLGAVPPFYSLVSPSCPMTNIPRHVRAVCENHTMPQEASERRVFGGAADGVCPSMRVASDGASEGAKRSGA